MEVIVKRQGSSAVVRIPASIMADANLQLGSVVDIYVEQGRVVIEKVTPEPPDLDALLAGITPENVHAEVIFG